MPFDLNEPNFNLELYMFDYAKTNDNNPLGECRVHGQIIVAKFMTLNASWINRFQFRRCDSERITIFPNRTVAKETLKELHSPLLQMDH